METRLIVVDSVKPVFARKCSFQVCSVFILATKGYKVGLGEIGEVARKLKKLGY